MRDHSFRKTLSTGRSWPSHGLPLCCVTSYTGNVLTDIIRNDRDSFCAVLRPTYTGNVLTDIICNDRTLTRQLQIGQSPWSEHI